MSFVLILRCGIGKLQAGIARTAGGMTANAPFKHTQLNYTPIESNPLLPEGRLLQRHALIGRPFFSATPLAVTASSHGNDYCTSKSSRLPESRYTVFLADCRIVPGSPIE